MRQPIVASVTFFTHAPYLGKGPPCPPSNCCQRMVNRFIFIRILITPTQVKAAEFHALRCILGLVNRILVANSLHYAVKNNIFA